MKESEAKINCMVFQTQQDVISNLSAKINRAKSVEEKAVFAKDLQKEVDVLLSCSDYDENRLDCTNCHFIAALRDRTASLIIKAKKLVQ